MLPPWLLLAIPSLCTSLALPVSSHGPANVRASDYSFVVVGHTRGGPDNGIIPTERLTELVEDIRALRPDFVVLTGDLIYGDINKQWDPPPVQLDEAALRSDWEAIDRIFATLEVPVHRAPGNHDLWDHTTLAIWKERYGPPYRSFRHGDGLFLLLNSCWLPTEGDPAHLPGGFIRGLQLPDDQLEWLRGELEASADAEHVFAFMGHVLWWNDDAAWWSEVHPLLASGPTRAVFAGDLGPWKWSHLERDGIHYVQSAVEFTVPTLTMLQNREASRTISSQLDNYVHVTVAGGDVRYDVRTVGGMSTGRFQPSVYRDVYEYDKGSLERKVFKRMDTPQKLVRWLAILGAGAFGAGLVGGLIAAALFRRKSA